METIFDHNVTDDELVYLFGDTFTKEEFIEMSEGCTQEDFDVDLYRLFNFRHDEDKAQYYLDRIPDTTFKAFTLLNHDLFIGEYLA